VEESAYPFKATAENCGVETSSKKAKTKVKVYEDERDVLKSGFETVTNALMKSTAELVKPTHLLVDDPEFGSFWKK